MFLDIVRTVLSVALVILFVGAIASSIILFIVPPSRKKKVKHPAGVSDPVEIFEMEEPVRRPDWGTPVENPVDNSVKDGVQGPLLPVIEGVKWTLTDAPDHIKELAKARAIEQGIDVSLVNWDLMLRIRSGNFTKATLLFSGDAEKGVIDASEELLVDYYEYMRVEDLKRRVNNG